MTKGVEERNDECVLRWFGHFEKMEKKRIANRVYVGEYTGSRSVGSPRKRWIDSMNDCLKKRGLDARQGRWCMIGLNSRGL